ncbi:MAG: hypothetical protein LBM38_01655, partial [Clostridiales bacterium]|nr:hypothetical protein [Clostridiales bacterium]
GKADACQGSRKTRFTFCGKSGTTRNMGDVFAVLAKTSQVKQLRRVYEQKGKFSKKEQMIVIQ